MLTFTVLKRDRRKFLALTGLTLKEFKILLPAFEKAYQAHYAGPETAAGHKRKRKAGGGRHGQLATIEQKLLFILVYQKTYPLQVVLGELFGISQSAANQWIHRLLPILQAALQALGVAPERDGQKFAQAERRQPGPREYIIDGTERRRLRPKNKEKQAQHYSGKKKAHTDKNVIVSCQKTNRVGYLSPTRVGKTHDKKLAEQEQIVYPRKATLGKDTGFQGYEPTGVRTYQPKKSHAAESSHRVKRDITVRCRGFVCGSNMRLPASNARGASKTR